MACTEKGSSVGRPERSATVAKRNETEANRRVNEEFGVEPNRIHERHWLNVPEGLDRGESVNAW